MFKTVVELAEEGLAVRRLLRVEAGWTDSFQQQLRGLGSVGAVAFLMGVAKAPIAISKNPTSDKPAVRAIERTSIGTSSDKPFGEEPVSRQSHLQKTRWLSGRGLRAR